MSSAWEEGVSVECRYCKGQDHLISACTKKARQEVFERLLAFIGMLIMGPFWILGYVSGLFAGAMISGFNFGKDIWNETMVRAYPKREGGENDSTC
jgi:hypothetical protein